MATVTDIKKFALSLQGHSALPPIPKRKGPFIRMVVEEFEKRGVVHSRTGTTAQIAMCWCVTQKIRFEMLYEPSLGYTVIKRAWTLDVPTEPGWYWCRESKGVVGALRYLHFSHKKPGRLGFEANVSNWTSKTAFIPVDDTGWEFIGPITQGDVF